MVMRCVALVGLLLAPSAAFTTSTNRLVTPVSRSSDAGGMTMKLFDWKRREANEDCESSSDRCLHTPPCWTRYDSIGCANHRI